MSNKERIRETVLKELTQGSINGSEAAMKMGVSLRPVKRLKRAYAHLGADSLIHQLRGVEGSRKIPHHIETAIVHIIREHYHDFGPTLAQEKLGFIQTLKVCIDTLALCSYSSTRASYTDLCTLIYFINYADH